MNELETTETSVTYPAYPIELESESKSTWKTSKSAWEDLQRSVDEQVLAAFDTNTGCPGCADEQTEWVEIKFSDGSKRALSYNAGSAPPPLAALVKKIRAALNTSDQAGPTLNPGVLTISPGVASGNLIHRVDPVYPLEAQRKHIQGDVLLEATIGKDGRLHDLRVVSGKPELVGAALSAVEQWRYRPYRLNGKLVEVQTTLSVLITDPPPAGATATGPVSDAAAAKRRAENILAPKKWVFPPLTAKLKDGVWTVMGTVRCQEALPQPKISCFGGAGVRIRKTDGEVLEVVPPLPPQK